MTDEEGFDNHASMIHAGTFTTTTITFHCSKQEWRTMRNFTEVAWESTYNNFLK
jgi:hypothetical protein